MYLSKSSRRTLYVKLIKCDVLNHLEGYSETSIQGIFIKNFLDILQIQIHSNTSVHHTRIIQYQTSLLLHISYLKKKIELSTWKRRYRTLPMNQLTLTMNQAPSPYGGAYLWCLHGCVSGSWGHIVALCVQLEVMDQGFHTLLNKGESYYIYIIILFVTLYKQCMVVCIVFSSIHVIHGHDWMQTWWSSIYLYFLSIRIWEIVVFGVWEIVIFGFFFSNCKL